MSRKIATIFAAAFALLVGSQCALAEDNLFKGYAYNSPLENYAVTKGYYDCSEDIGGTARCIDNVDFVGQKFSAALVFSAGKLIIVTLVSPSDQDVYTKASAALSKSFTVVSMTDDKTILDLIDLAATAKNKDEYISKFSNFENVGLGAGNLTYTFLEGVKVKSSLRNASSMLAAAPDNTRSAELIVSGKGADALLLVRFTFPKLEAKKSLEAAQEPAESF
ncbi:MULTISPECIES: hypothetical protein [Pseudomonas]|uniref:hypothetical protein n=1 Tax=Pseudomonas TaxID=286 RepID=UPI001472FA19|nr:MULTISPECIES: hypothetical protein [Pseudomonas]NNA42338.1 hypothetical protein [Pseudomonas lundensis]WRQ74035.1 hypothetical protein VQY67_18270 [Pseudomonas saxonica]